MPTANGDVKAQFEFDMFGTGGDAGQTTIRLRHAWGQWKQIGAGQTNSQFMDPDVFPNIARVLGTERHAVLPQRRRCSGSRSRRRLERRASPSKRPGASGDAGVVRRPCRAAERQGPVPAPDFTGHYRLARQVGLRRRSAARSATSSGTTCCRTTVRPERQRLGWGISLSSNLKVDAKATSLALAVRLRRRHRELLQRRADRHRHQEQSRQHRSRRSSAKPLADLRHWSSSSITTGTTDGHELRSATRASTSTTATARRPNAFKAGQYVARQPAVHAGAERDDGRRAPVGPAARTSPTASRPTGSSCSSRSNTTSR